jgi:ubiquinone/menaquinone biosynthesis C-methylase UbiE
MKMTAVEKHFVNSPGHTVQVAHRAQLLLDRIDYQPGWRYLDVGCGVGASACEIAKSCGMDVTGVDVDPKQIEAAKARGASPRLRFETMDATQLNFREAEFDIVASSKATHHIPRWEQALSEMIRVLRPGGYLIYTDFMFPSWLATAGRLIPFVSIPSKKRVEALAMSAGLTKIYQSRAGLQFEFIWLRNS